MKYKVKVITYLDIETSEESMNLMLENYKAQFRILNPPFSFDAENVLTSLAENIASGFPKGLSYLGEADIDYEFEVKALISGVEEII
jgi:hypothetical protein